MPNQVFWDFVFPEGAGVVELEDVAIPLIDCGNFGEVATDTQIVQVLKGVNGSEALLWVYLFNEIFEVRKYVCEQKKKQPIAATLLASGFSGTGDTITYTDVISEDVRSVILVITGAINKLFQAYKVTATEIEGKFGHVGISVAAPNGGKAYLGERAQDVWTRETIYKIPDVNLPKRVRVSLKPGFNWLLYDSGER